MTNDDQPMITLDELRKLRDDLEAGVAGQRELQESLAKVQALISAAAEGMRPFLEAIVAAIAPVLRDLAEIVRRWDEAVQQSPTGAPQHGPARDPFRRGGRG
jgi:hypothetical protein